MKKLNEKLSEALEIEPIPITTEIVEVKDITPPKNEEHMTTEERAAKYRSEADRLYKEAAKLRKMALELDPKEK